MPDLPSLDDMNSEISLKTEDVDVAKEEAKRFMPAAPRQVLILTPASQSLLIALETKARMCKDFCDAILSDCAYLRAQFVTVREKGDGSSSTP